MHLLAFTWVVFCWLFLLTIGKLPDIPTPIMVSNDDEYIFIHDSISSHKDWSITTLSAEKLFSWKGNSLDMNVIEYYVRTHKNKLSRKSSLTKNNREKHKNV